MWRSEHWKGHGRDLILFTIGTRRGVLINSVCAPLLFWLIWLRSVRLTLLAGSFARARTFIGPASLRDFVVHTIVTPLETILALWASRVAPYLARPTIDTGREWKRVVEAGLFEWKATKNEQNGREVTHHWRHAITPDETLREAGPGLGEDGAADASATAEGAAGLGVSTVSSIKGETSGG